MDKNYEMALQYLRNLDPRATEFTFQTFDDDKNRKSKSLARIFHGTLEAHYKTLCELNGKGAGIYVTVQQTDLNGRKKENIKALRTLYFEYDGGNGFKPSKIPFPPSQIVRTSPPDKYHLYYILDELQPISDMSVDQFNSAMAYMIDKGSDPNAKDISRVLRLPGFINNKYPEKPLVTLDSGRCNKHKWAEMIDAFKAPELELSAEDIDFFESSSEEPSFPAAKSKEPFEHALIASALSAIDPGCEYDIWLKIGMALHHASGGGKHGYEMFKTWSQSGHNYKSHDWPGKWHTFRQETKNPVTIASLYHYAREAGWDGRYNTALEDIHSLINAERGEVFKHLNRTHAVITTLKGVKVVYKCTDDLGRLTYGIMGDRDARVLFENRKVPTWGTPRADGSQSLLMKNIYSEWIGSKFRKEFKGLTFDPRADIRPGPEPFLLPDTPKLNTYFGLHNAGSFGAWRTIGKHIREIWCKGDEKAFAYILNWFARMYQFPGKPALTCVTVRSDKQGAGKNVIADFLVDSFGIHGARFSTSKSITGRFNSRLAGAIFVLLEEAVWSDSHQAKSFLKSAITSPTIDSERKHEDSREIKNCSHIMCLSNNDWVVPIEPTDRRYYILDCDNKYADNSKPRNVEYFRILRRCIKKGEGDAFIDHLIHRDISSFNPFDFPKDDYARAKAMVIQLNSLDAFIMESLTEGSITFCLGGQESEGTLPIEGHINIPRTLFMDAYQAYYRKYRAERKRWELMTPIQVGMHLKTRTFPDKTVFRVSSARVEGSKTPVASYLLADKYTLRRHYEAYLGNPVDWALREEDEPDFSIFD